MQTDTTPPREVRERLARCVATMVFYQADGWSWSAVKLLDEVVAELIGWAEWDPLRDAILDPLEGELVVRFGPAVGGKLHREFLRAYGLATEQRPDDEGHACARHFRRRGA